MRYAVDGGEEGVTKEGRKGDDVGQSEWVFAVQRWAMSCSLLTRTSDPSPSLAMWSALKIHCAGDDLRPPVRRRVFLSGNFR